MGDAVLHNALLVFGVTRNLSTATNCVLDSGPIGDEVLWNGKIFRPHVRPSVPPLGHLARLEAQPTRLEAEPTRPEAK